MNIFKFSLSIILPITILWSCNSPHFIPDAEYRQSVENDYKEKIVKVGNANLFPNFEQLEKLSRSEKEALQFLYAYMPLSDIADYTPEFYLANIRQSFLTQHEMPWGKEVPKKLFRHFVLPVRVNNENLDSARFVLYAELKERVKNHTLPEAILEVNHWCHEKVTYQPSDARTSSPLASIRTAYGRCGEESTFTVAALRAVGIPARQVYTPRWAHTDNNHAWVEAWADGKWHYLGACEPAPVLNMGWFDSPVKRALLLHTKVFGKYDGPENIMRQTPSFAEINVTSNYAPVTKTNITVVDTLGNIVPNANVEFGIYNYAEFYPVLSVKSSPEGKASISTGKGDISVWVSKNGMKGLTIISAGEKKENKITLDFKAHDTFVKELDIVPPIEIAPDNSVSQELIDMNNIRLVQEDSIRNAYTDTFISESDAKKVASGINADTAIVNRFLKNSRGNWSEIKRFLENAGKERKKLALMLLDQISEKDLRDVPATILLDHLHNVTPDTSETFYRYVLNPRVDFEMLTPYRSWLQKNIPADIQHQAEKSPSVLVSWINKEISIKDELNPQQIPISPKGVMRLSVADKKSRNIFFVAVCRSLGIPARIEKITGQLQYFHIAQWHNVNFNDSQPKALTSSGFIKLNYKPTQILQNPQYDTHFTIIRMDGDAMSRLNFRNTEGGKSTVTWRTLFSKPVAIEEGSYAIVTGTRMASGKVLARITSFVVKKDAITPVDLIMRSDDEDIQVIGSMDAEALFLPENSTVKKSILTTSGRGYFAIALLDAGKEPSNHFVRDLARLKADFEKWDRQMILLFKDNSQLLRFRKEEFPTLPKNITFGIDEDVVISNMLQKGVNLPSAQNLPIVVIADTFGRIIFVSQGYSIGIGDRMLKVIKQL